MTLNIVLLTVLICATFFRLSAEDARTRKQGRRRHSAELEKLDTSFPDAVLKAFHNMAAEKGVKLNDKFNRAINDIEKSLAIMKGRRKVHSGWRGRAFVSKLWNIMERAAKSGNMEGFRQALGRALYANLTLEQEAKHTKDTSELVQGAKKFLEDIKKNIGDKKFEELISINGEVTLVFVMDTTGSMGDDIDAAKAIAEQIIRHPRDVPVSFILSKFNDPEVYPVIFREEGELSKAIDDISNITVVGGDDCPEMAFEGILQALYYVPLPGSAMYVFTDAGPKDATPENIETVKALSIDLGIPIYFFVRGDCGEPLESYTAVAQDTGGHVFPLQSSEEIKRMSVFVNHNLKSSGTLVADKTKNAQKEKGYSILVDDTIQTLVVTVTVENSALHVALFSPNDVKQTVTQQLELNVIFEVKNPKPGNWTLVVPFEAGDHHYGVKTISKLNIDFSYYYFVYKKKSDEDFFPVNHPLLGKDAWVMIKISQMDQVDKNTLHLKVLYENGTDGGDFKLFKLGTSGMRFRAKLQLHPGPYKLHLSGRTKTGHLFTRLAPKFDEAKPFRLRLVWASKYTLPLGKASYLMLTVENLTSNMKNFTLNVTDSLGYVSFPEAKGARAKRRHKKYFKLEFNVPANATENVNKANRVVIKAIDQDSGVTSTLVSYLLITPD